MNQTIKLEGGQRTMESWHSYPSIYNLGHKALEDLFKEPVIVEEKIDGSQFSFGRFETADGIRLRCRSKGAELNLVAPEPMFNKAIASVRALEERLTLGWTYRTEYLAKPKHNSLTYDRHPKDHLIIFDINTGEERYMSYAEKSDRSAELGLETVPLLHEGMIDDINLFRALLDRESCLGGQKIEGVVIKNYHRFGPDKKALMGKFVSEHFREVHKKEWKKENPSTGDVLQNLINVYKSPARWQKAVQHLRERGEIQDSMRDIPFLLKEVPLDVVAECEAEIRDALWHWAWPKIRRGITGGLPEWYKERLLEKQFSSEEVPS